MDLNKEKEASEPEAAPATAAQQDDEGGQQTQCKNRRQILRERLVTRKLKAEKKLQECKGELECAKNVAPTTREHCTPSRRLSASALAQSAPSSPSSASVVVDLRPRQSQRMDNTSQEVKREASVLARVSHLQQQGLWTDNKLTKAAAEPSVGKVHWGYVLEEMAWMANVFQVRVFLEMELKANELKFNLFCFRLRLRRRRTVARSARR